jgi:hypothetical protein
MIATMDPGQADAVIVGQGYAPLWEYFSRLLKAKPGFWCLKARLTNARPFGCTVSTD